MPDVAEEVNDVAEDDIAEAEYGVVVFGRTKEVDGEAEEVIEVGLG